MTVGLITHLDNPTLAEVRELGLRAEEAGADWLGLPDAFSKPPAGQLTTPCFGPSHRASSTERSGSSPKGDRRD
jgi:hypothetical protein